MLNNEPTRFIEYISDRASSRIGFYFEALISFLLNEYPEFELIAEHLQLHQNGKTLGEIDFLYKNMNTGEITHLEVAIKYYLGSSQWRSINHPFKHWLGPMIKDRLDLKSNHLINHQTAISDSEAFRDLAREQDLPQPTRKSVMLLGYLFRNPKENLNLSISNNTQESNHWYKLSDIKSYLSTTHKYVVPKKPYWLGPHHKSEDNNFWSSNDLPTEARRIIKEWKRPILVSAIPIIEFTEEKEFYKEDKRFFIVPDNWAGLSKPNQP